MLPAKDVADRLDMALTLAQGAGDLTLSYFHGRDLQIEIKADASPVTIADRETEAWLRTQLARLAPDDGILGEEAGETSGTSGFRWVLDPIDGTISFVHGVPFYANLIGLEYKGEAVAGIISFPALQEMLWGTSAQTRWRRGAEPAVVAQVSSTFALSDSMFVSTSPDYFDQTQTRPLYDELVARAAISRGFPDAYAFAMVITGRADVAVEPVVKRWDLAPIKPLVEGAGGRFSDFAGRADIGNGTAVVSNGSLHSEVLTITKCHPVKELVR